MAVNTENKCMSGVGTFISGLEIVGMHAIFPSTNTLQSLSDVGGVVRYLLRPTRTKLSPVTFFSHVSFTKHLCSLFLDATEFLLNGRLIVNLPLIFKEKVKF